MADMQSLFLEDSFTLYVGPEEKVVKIPPSLLSQHSAPLKAMISNGMKETTKKMATLPDEEPETLGYFLEWAVKGIYRVAETKAVNDIEPQHPGNVANYSCNQCLKFASTPTQINMALWCVNCKVVPVFRCARCKATATFRTSLETECKNASCTSRVQQQRWVEGEDFKFRDHLKEYSAARYAPVGAHTHKAIGTFLESSLIEVPTTGNLLAHAKVHVFAEKYLIKDLEQMARHLLIREILNYSVDKLGSHGFASTIEYAYQHSGDFDGSNDLGILKQIVLTHAAINSDKLLACKGFCDLVLDGGEFALDFAKIQSKHLV